MDWTLVERLAPSIAWPLAAVFMFLCAIPLLNHKLLAIAKAISDLRTMPESLAKSLSSFEAATSTVSRETRNIEAQIEVLQAKMGGALLELKTVTQEIEKAQSALQTTQAAIDEDRMEADTQAIKSLVGSAGQLENEGEADVEEMHQKLIGNWKLLERELEARSAIAGIEFDVRRPGSAAFALTDRRRKNHLTRQQADLITRLGRQFRKFEKLAEQTEDWLTFEAYSAFMNGVNQAREAVKLGHSANSTDIQSN